MKRLSKLSTSNRFSASKQNHHHKPLSLKQNFIQKLQEPIQSWKQNPDRIILTDTTNQCRNKKYSLPSRSRLSTVESVRDVVVEEDNSRKVSEIEILKRQALYLDRETIEERKTTSPEFIKTEPAHVMEMTPIKLDNWLKTTNNGFFRSQQRHATLEKKRHRIKKLRKIDILNMNGLTQCNTRMFKQSLLKQIQQINKPLILYPLMDLFYQEQIKQRLNTPLLKSKQSLKRQKNSTSEAKKERDERQGEPIRIKTMGNWKTEMRQVQKSADMAKGFNRMQEVINF